MIVTLLAATDVGSTAGVVVATLALAKAGEFGVRRLNGKGNRNGANGPPATERVAQLEIQARYQNQELGRLVKGQDEIRNSVNKLAISVAATNMSVAGLQKAIEKTGG